MNKKLRILWAVNPLNLSARSLAHLEGIFTLAGGDLQVQPVYVAGLAELSISGDLFESSSASIKKGAELSLKTLLAKLLKKKLVEKPKVLYHRGKSLESEVDLLLDYSKKIQSDFILLGVSQKSTSNGNKFGSFSQVLLSRSPQASIAVGLKNKGEKQPYGKVLYATDLSRDSFLDFIKFSFISKKLGSEVTFVQVSGAEGQAAKRLKHFTDLAKKCGIKTSYADIGSKNPTANELARYAKENHFSFMGLPCSALNSI